MKLRTLLDVLILVLMVEFASGQFNGSILSGFMEVAVRITGGTSSAPINVTVTPGLQSPTSANGKFDLKIYNQILTVNMYVHMYMILYT